MIVKVTKYGYKIVGLILRVGLEHKVKDWDVLWIT